MGKFLADLVHAMGGAVNAVRFREINLLSHKLVNSCRICKEGSAHISLAIEKK